MTDKLITHVLWDGSNVPLNIFTQMIESGEIEADKALRAITDCDARLAKFDARKIVTAIFDQGYAAGQSSIMSDAAIVEHNSALEREIEEVHLRNEALVKENETQRRMITQFITEQKATDIYQMFLTMDERYGEE